jgi:hypothetical protein
MNRVFGSVGPNFSRVRRADTLTLPFGPVWRCPAYPFRLLSAGPTAFLFARIMYAKIFEQIFDSSIAEDYKVRLVFEDMLVLARSDGVVDMTHEAISRRTNVPLEMVRQAISDLEKPDGRSRSKALGGARLKRLDKHRDWGWRIVNYHTYRMIATEVDRKLSEREKKRKYRLSRSALTPIVRDMVGTDGGHYPSPSPSPYASPSASEGRGMQGGGVKIPTLPEWLAICEIQGIPRWKAEDEFNRQEAIDPPWQKARGNLAAHAARVRTWWQTDGCPTEMPIRNGHAKPNADKVREEIERLYPLVTLTESERIACDKPIRPRT